jgi:hypothetical protein
MASGIETLRFLGQLIPKSAEDPTSHDNIAKSACRNMAQAFVSRWKLTIDDLTRASPQIAQSTHYFLSVSRPDAPTVLEVIEEYMKLDMGDEGLQILQQNLPALPASSHKFWVRWHALHPFYRSLLSILERHDSAPLSDLASKWLINAMTKAAEHLVHARPKEPPGWSAPRLRRITCVCKHCRALEQFLNDDTQATRRFPEIASTRKHLENALGQTPDLEIETEKNGLPYTLVVHKIRIEYTHAKALWDRELAKMRKEVGAFCSPFTTKLFGGVLTQLVGLEKRPVTAEAAGKTVRGSGGGNADGATGSTPRSLQPVTASVQNAVAPLALAGTKRKADVIDLTEDDPI